MPDTARTCSAARNDTCSDSAKIKEAILAAATLEATPRTRAARCCSKVTASGRRDKNLDKYSLEHPATFAACVRFFPSPLRSAENAASIVFGIGRAFFGCGAVVGNDDSVLIEPTISRASRGAFVSSAPHVVA